MYYITRYAREISQVLFKLQFKAGVYNGEELFEVIENGKGQTALFLPGGENTILNIYVSLDIDAVAAYFEIFDIEKQKALNEVGKAAQNGIVQIPFSALANAANFKDDDFMIINGWII